MNYIDELGIEDEYVAIIRCSAPEIVFTAPEFADIPEEHRKKIEEQHGLACDGGGVPGFWCRGCCYVRVTDHEP